MFVFRLGLRAVCVIPVTLLSRMTCSHDACHAAQTLQLQVCARVYTLHGTVQCSSGSTSGLTVLSTHDSTAELTVTVPLCHPHWTFHPTARIPHSHNMSTLLGYNEWEDEPSESERENNGSSTATDSHSQSHSNKIIIKRECHTASSTCTLHCAHSFAVVVAHFCAFICY